MNTSYYSFMALFATSLATLCFGCTGAAGPEGATGKPGISSLVITTVERPGAHCPEGGTKLEVGVDKNSNGVLDLGTNEITDTIYICNGATGNTGPQGEQGESHLSINTTQLSDADPRCPAGGVRIDIQDGDIITQSQYVCHGEQGAQGPSGNFTLNIDSASESICPTGGIRFSVYNSTTSTLQDKYVCNGETGPTATFAASEVPVGNGHCPNGGTVVQTMVGNAPQGDPFYVCNGNDGAPGSNGQDGLISLVNVTRIDAESNDPLWRHDDRIGHRQKPQQSIGLQRQPRCAIRL